MKIIIYALGQIFERYKEKINWKDITALCDKSTEAGRNFHEYRDLPVISPSKLDDFEYDFVAVFSNTFFEEIKRELVGEYFVLKDKVISWREIIEADREMTFDILEFCRMYFKQRKYKRYLDIGMNYLPKSYLTKAELLLGEDIILDGIRSGTAEFNENLYDDIYEDKKEVKDWYDIAFLWQEPQGKEEILHFVCRHARYIVFCMKRSSIPDLETMKEVWGQFGRIKCISTVKGDFWVIDTERQSFSGNISIYVVTHKKYNLNTEIPYIPLCVGGYQKKGYLTEHTGENIAYLNKKINECTALYWIWKNTETEYAGFNHYRRYFFNNEIESMDNYLDLEHINEIFEKYDIILPKTYPLDKMTILEQLQNSMNPELCEKGYLLMRKKIERNQPDYLNAFDSVMNGRVIFNCNIFVTKREILNRYCEWLFSFLIEAAEEIDVEGYDSYSRRVIGFFAERMWTVWLRKNKLRIKELPYVMIR